ncbi:MAG: hypothetical protein PHI93_03160 [Kiritimatiellae bacterium]|nr:hypothetical protein [Kiritimatiellia bacterium]
MEKSPKNLPYRGKKWAVFSIAWKNRKKVFHSVENVRSPRFANDRLGLPNQSISITLSPITDGAMQITYKYLLLPLLPYPIHERMPDRLTSSPPAATMVSA